MQDITITLPNWLRSFTQTYVRSSSPQAQMEFVLAAARENIDRQTGGPFAAGVFELNSGALVSLGVNLVQPQQLSMLHAEMLALSLAQRALGSYNLNAAPQAPYALVVSAEPCAMCLGALPWAGIGCLVTAATDADVRSIGFDEGDKPLDWIAGLKARQIEVIPQICRDEAQAVLTAYKQCQGDIYHP